MVERIMPKQDIFLDTLLSSITSVTAKNGNAENLRRLKKLMIQIPSEKIIHLPMKKVENEADFFKNALVAMSKAFDDTFLPSFVEVLPEKLEYTIYPDSERYGRNYKVKMYVSGLQNIELQITPSDKGPQTLSF